METGCEKAHQIFIFRVKKFKRKNNKEKTKNVNFRNSIRISEYWPVSFQVNISRINIFRHSTDGLIKPAGFSRFCKQQPLLAAPSC